MRSHVSSARRTALRCASSAILLGLAFVLSTPGVGSAQVKSTLEEAYAKFEEGDHSGAVELFENAFAQDPSNDALYNWVQQVQVASVYRMVRSENERLSGIAIQLLRAIRTVKLEKRSDDEEMRAAIEKAMMNPDERLETMLLATSQFGRNLVPHLIPYLASKELEQRTTAFTWITQRAIGVSAVPILQAARKHPDATVRLNVAKLLGTAPLRTMISLATLKAMMETDESDDVRAAASASFEAVLGGGEVRSAKRYFLQNGYRYYLRPHENLLGNSKAYPPTVYSLQGDKIVGERVASFQLGERMAKQALEEAIELDPEYRLAYVVSLCNDAAQVVEFDWNLDYYETAGGGENVLELLNGQKNYVDHVLRLRIVAAPTDVLALALRRALDDGRADVAGKLIQTIRDTRRRDGRLLSELVRALEDENSRLVRIAAAIALAEWNPADGFDAGGMVVSILSEAVVSSGVRIVQKIMGDRTRANHFDDVLRELNMESYSPLKTIEEGYATVLNSPPDAVLIDESVGLTDHPGSTAPINFFVSQLRKNYRTAGVPVIVAVPETRMSAAKQLYESEERNVFVVSDGIDSLGLKNLVLDRVFEGKDDAKSLATHMATEAAEALVHVASASHSLIPVESSVESLVKVLRNRPDEVRIPSIVALGRIGATEAAGELSVVYSNTQNAVAVRAAAMSAIGDVLQGGADATGSVMDAIQDGMMSSDPTLRRVAWYAFSGSGADGAARLAAMLSAAPSDVAEASEDAGEPEAVETPSLEDSDLDSDGF